MHKDSPGKKDYYKVPYTKEMTNNIYNEIYNVIETALYEAEGGGFPSEFVHITFDKVIDCFEGTHNV